MLRSKKKFLELEEVVSCFSLDEEFRSSKQEEDPLRRELREVHSAGAGWGSEARGARSWPRRVRPRARGGRCATRCFLGAVHAACGAGGGGLARNRCRSMGRAAKSVARAACKLDVAVSSHATIVAAAFRSMPEGSAHQG